MLSRLHKSPLRGVHITLLLTLVLTTLDGRRVSLIKYGFLAPTISNGQHFTKMNAEPAAAPGAAIARPVKDEKAAVDQSHLRQTIESIKQDASAESSDQAKQNRKEETIAWRVVLYNDDIHSFTYVTEALASAIPQLSREVAHTITVEAHNSGQATVLRTWQKKAEAYCTELQKRGLTVCTIHDSCPK